MLNRTLIRIFKRDDTHYWCFIRGWELSYREVLIPTDFITDLEIKNKLERHDFNVSPIRLFVKVDLAAKAGRDLGFVDFEWTEQIEDDYSGRFVLSEAAFKAYVADWKNVTKNEPFEAYFQDGKLIFIGSELTALRLFAYFYKQPNPQVRKVDGSINFSFSCELPAYKSPKALYFVHSESV